MLDIPSDSGVSSTFSAEDLTLYRGHDTDGDTEKQIISLLYNLPLVDKIVDVLDDQLVSTRQGGFQKFYVHWNNRPLSNASWITTTDFQRLNHIFMSANKQSTRRSLILSSQGELMQSDPRLGPACPNGLMMGST